MYYVYVLRNLQSRLYIGYTPDNVIRRLGKHNRGEVISTKNYRPWRLIYFEGYLNRKDALGREKFLKSGSGRNYLKKQLNNFFNSVQ